MPGLRRILRAFIAAIGVSMVSSIGIPATAASYDLSWSTSSIGSLETVEDYSETCTPNSASDGGADGPVDAFKFKTSPKSSPPQFKIQMNFPRHEKSRRLLGDSLTTLKRESTLAKTDPATYRPCENPNGTPPVQNSDAIFNSNQDPLVRQVGYGDPTRFRDHQWLYAPYLLPGPTQRIYSFVHNEYHGNDCSTDVPMYVDPYCASSGTAARDGCSTGDFPFHCWYSSVTLATSDGTETQWDGTRWDGTTATNAARSGQAAMPNVLGAVYLHPTSAPGDSSPYLVASIPYQYRKDWGRHGYGSVSNIIKSNEDGKYYMLVLAYQGTTSASTDQGVCLLQTSDLSQPTSWRAWDGQGFNRTLTDPYHPPPGDNAADHRCEYVAPSTIGTDLAPRSVRYDTYLKKYIFTANGGTNQEKVYYSLSDDFVNWSPPQLLMQPSAPLPGQCAESLPTYASILDPNDPANDPSVDPSDSTTEPNFNRPGRRPFLFFSKANVGANCQGQGTSSLVYQPFEFNLRHAGFEDSVFSDSSANASGFDQGCCSVPGQNYVGVSSSFPAYSGSKSLQAVTFGGPVPTYGRYSTCSTCIPATNTVKWDKGTDVWYGSAFWVPGGFQAEQKNNGLGTIRWQDGAGGYGGVFLDNAPGPQPPGYELMAGKPGTQTQLGNRFDLAPYENNWVWLQIHQRFDDGKPLSEVYVNGELKTSSTAVNNYSSGNNVATLVDYGFAAPQATQGTTLMYLDEPFIDASERSAIGAPRTPIGLRLFSPAPTAAGSQLSIAWNPSTPRVPGDSVNYRVYFRAPSTDCTWIKASIDSTQGSSTSFTDYFNGESTDYRVTAYETDPIGSAAGQPTTQESDVSAPLNVSPTFPPAC